MANILVTGANGNVGSETVFRLLKQGGEVRAAVRDEAKAITAGLTEVPLVLFDYRRPETFEAAFDGIERVLFIPPPVELNQAEAMKPAIEYAAARVQQIVVLTAMGSDQARNPLGEVEKLVRGAKVRWTILRPNWFMQGFNTYFLHQIREQDGLFIAAGDARISFVDVRDVADAAAAALLHAEVHAHNAYTLTGPQTLDHFQVARVLSDVTGRQIDYHPVPPDEFHDVLVADGMPEYAVNAFMWLLDGVRTGHYARVTDHVKQATGHPATDFRTYAQDHVGVWQPK